MFYHDWKVLFIYIYYWRFIILCSFPKPGKFYSEDNYLFEPKISPNFWTLINISLCMFFLNIKPNALP